MGTLLETGKRSPGKSSAGRARSRALDWLVAGTRADSSMAYLDGLRGIAILYVMFGHFSLYDPSGFWVKAVGPGATYGVYLFFLLSSFLLTGLLVTAFLKRGIWSELFPYIRRRFLRIYPMFIATLIVLALVPNYYEGVFGNQQVSLLEQLFLIHARSIFWAVSVEFEFYLALPLIALAFVALRGRTRLILLLALLTIVVAQWIYGSYNRGLFPNGYPHLLPYLLIFLLGSALAIGKLLVDDGTLPRPPSWLGNIVLVVGFLGQIWSLPGTGQLTLNDYVTNRWHLLAADLGGNAILWACVFFGLVFGSDMWRRWLSGTMLRWIGIVSYSAYLTHILVFRQIAAPLISGLGFYVAAAVCLAVTLALSTCTYALIERPFIRFR